MTWNIYALFWWCTILIFLLAFAPGSTVHRIVDLLTSPAPYTSSTRQSVAPVSTRFRPVPRRAVAQALAASSSCPRTPPSASPPCLGTPSSFHSLGPHNFPDFCRFEVALSSLVKVSLEFFAIQCEIGARWIARTNFASRINILHVYGGSKPTKHSLKSYIYS